MNWQTVPDQPSELSESRFGTRNSNDCIGGSDIEARGIRRARMASRSIESWASPLAPGCIAPARTNGHCTGLVIALRDGIYRARDWGGAILRRDEICR